MGVGEPQLEDEQREKSRQSSQKKKREVRRNKKSGGRRMIKTNGLVQGEREEEGRVEGRAVRNRKFICFRRTQRQN